MAAEWLEGYEKVANMAAGGTVGSSLQLAVDGLDERLKHMEIDPSHYRLTPRELKRRRKLVNDLRQEYDLSPPQVYGGGTFVRPDAAVGSGGNGGTSVATQKMILKEQDVVVDEIAAGVDRLHGRALNINEETNLHKNLLDDMDVDVEGANDELRAQARHAMEVRRKSGNCYLYICIVVLLIILTFLLILGFQ